MDSKSFVRAFCILRESWLAIFVLSFKALPSAGSMHCKDTSRYPKEPPKNIEKFAQVSPSLFFDGSRRLWLKTFLSPLTPI